jgi:hypothetical protein
MASKESRATSMPGPRQASARVDLIDVPPRDEAVGILLRRHDAELLRRLGRPGAAGVRAVVVCRVRR